MISQVEEFLKSYSEVKKQAKVKQSEQSLIDKRLSDFYHTLEGTTITHVAQSHKLLKELKVILEERRNIKADWIILNAVLQTVGDRFDGLRNKCEKLEKTHTKMMGKMIAATSE